MSFDGGGGGEYTARVEGFSIRTGIAVQEKSKDNAETRRAQRFAEKSSEKRLAPQFRSGRRRRA
jgi:hypothetical protein